MTDNRRFRAMLPVTAMALAVSMAMAILPGQVAAQDSTRILTPGGLPCSYDGCVLRVEDGWFSRKLLRGPQGIEVARLGFRGPSLASMVQLSDSAVVHARRYQRAQAVGATLTTVGSITAIAATIVLNQQNRDVRDEALAVNVGGLAVWVVGNSFLYKARRELSRSVWWYNRKVMEGR